MTIRQRLERLLPRNRETGWPVWVQLPVFLLIELLFYLSVTAVQTQLYSGGVPRWADDAFGMQHSMAMLEGVAMLCATVLCAVRMGLHRAVPFGSHEPRRWTILPVTLWYGGVHFLTTLLVRVLPQEIIPVLTDDLLVYPVVHAGLLLLSFLTLAVMVRSLRRGNGRKARLLLAAQLAIVLAMGVLNVSNMQVQDRLLFGSLGQPDGPTAVITEPVIITAGDMPEDVADFFSGLSEDPEAFLRFVTGEDAGDGGAVFSTPDMAAYEKAMAPVNALSDVLCAAQAVLMFFIMKKWLFPVPEPVDETGAGPAPEEV